MSGNSGNLMPKRDRAGRIQDPRMLRSGECITPPRGTIVPLAVVMIALASCTTVPVTTVDQDVKGTTIEQVINELSKKSSSEIGTTTVDMSPQVFLVESSDECRVARAFVKYDVEVVLPRFSESRQMDPKARAVLQEVRLLTRDIARSHREIAKYHAREIGRQLRNLSPEQTCKRLFAVAKRTVQKGYRAYDKDRDRFDAELKAAIRKASS